jgi:hypothetical protein
VAWKKYPQHGSDHRWRHVQVLYREVTVKTEWDFLWIDNRESVMK